jgi:hypothetical protein
MNRKMPYSELVPSLMWISPSLNSKQDSTGGLPDWVASFIRRVIQLLENLPDEGPDGSAGGATEGESLTVWSYMVWTNTFQQFKLWML